MSPRDTEHEDPTADPVGFLLSPPALCLIGAARSSVLSLWPGQKARMLPQTSSSLESSKQSGTSPGEFLHHSRWGNPELDVQPVTHEESSFRHSGWAPRRLQIWNALKRIATPDARLSKFANCGAGLWLEMTTDRTDIRCRCNKCGDRWCMRCQGERSALIVEAVTRLIESKPCRFVTFTLRHSRTPLTDQIDRLYRSFTRLRHRKSWLQHVTGGAAFFEAKVGERDGLWHVHLHVIAEGHYFDQRHLSQEWHAVTGDSSIVDIRAISDAEGRARYVTKYVTKPADSSVFAVPDRLDEMMIALRGRRLCLTFGSWRGTALEELEEDTRGWKSLGPVHTLVSRAQTGDDAAASWLQAAARKYPAFAQYFTSAPAPPIDPP
jgi:hypothetical protein